MAVNKPNFFKTFDSRHRLLLCLGIATFVSVVVPPWFRLSTRILCTWNSGVDFFLALTWWTMVKSKPETMRRRAQSQYEGRFAVFCLIIAAACVSLLAIGFILSDKKGLSPDLLKLHVALSFLTIVSSWLLVHTVFTLQYAYSYYENHRTNSNQKAGGLDFPNDGEADYWDFLYFSFVIGMTSQVSDIQTTSRIMRQLALMHGVLSFFFNTTILAMSINIIASLI
jgi:uncharacterized membrane protein